jgi:long-chain acyl-CoA synthetase
MDRPHINPGFTPAHERLVPASPQASGPAQGRGPEREPDLEPWHEPERRQAPGRPGADRGWVEAATSAATLPAHLARHASLRPEAPALRQKSRGRWTTWSWAALADEVARVARGLGALGFDGGDMLVLLGHGHTSRRQLVLTLGAQVRGGAVLAVADAVDPATVAALIRTSGARYVFASDHRQVDRALAAVAENARYTCATPALGAPPFSAVVFDDGRGLGPGYADLPLHSYDAVLRSGAAAPPDESSSLEPTAPPDRDCARPLLAGARALGVWVPDDSREADHDPQADRRDDEVRDAGDADTGSLRWLTHAELVEGSLAHGDGQAATAAAAEDEALIPQALSSRAGALALAQWQISGFCLSCAEADGSPEQDRREVAPTVLIASTGWYARLWQDVERRLPPPGSWRRRLVSAALGRSARANAGAQRAAVPATLRARPLDRVATALVTRPLARALGLGRARLAIAVGRQPLGPAEAHLLSALGIRTRRLSLLDARSGARAEFSSDAAPPLPSDRLSTAPSVSP